MLKNSFSVARSETGVTYLGFNNHCFAKSWFFFLKLIIYIFSYHFDVLMSKIIFFKKNIILMHFQVKSTLKNNHYHTFKHPFSRVLKQIVFSYFRFILLRYRDPNLGSDRQCRSGVVGTPHRHRSFAKPLNMHIIKQVI